MPLHAGAATVDIALSGEFFVETAAAIRSAVAQGPSPENRIDDLLVACYANDYVGYVIPEGAYAARGYESGVTFCSENAERMIADAAISLLASL